MSSGCGDVLSLEDLRIAKLHQLFEAEVITGKQGGLASGMDIDYATNQVTGQTQKTLPAVLRDAGFSPVSWDFSTGGTLTVNDRNRVVYDPVSKAWYSWAGALPKVVAAGTNPVGDINWIPKTDPSLRQDLATSSGSSLIGAFPQGTLKQSFTSVSADQFGAKGDGSTDDTVAIQAAIDWVFANGGGSVRLGPKTYRAANLLLKPRVVLDGVTKETTMIKAVNGWTGNAVVMGQGYLTYKTDSATQPVPACFSSGLRNITIHGNKQNFSGTAAKDVGCGVLLAGANIILDDVKIIYVPSVGLVTLDWGTNRTLYQSADPDRGWAHIGLIRGVRIQFCGNDCWHCEAQDYYLDDVEIVGAGDGFTSTVDTFSFWATSELVSNFRVWRNIDIGFMHCYGNYNGYDFVSGPDTATFFIRVKYDVLICESACVGPWFKSSCYVQGGRLDVHEISQQKIVAKHAGGYPAACIIECNNTRISNFGSIEIVQNTNDNVPVSYCGPGLYLGGQFCIVESYKYTRSPTVAAAYRGTGLILEGNNNQVLSGIIKGFYLTDSRGSPSSAVVVSSGAHTVDIEFGFGNTGVRFVGGSLRGRLYNLGNVDTWVSGFDNATTNARGQLQLLSPTGGNHGVIRGAAGAVATNTTAVQTISITGLTLPYVPAASEVTPHVVIDAYGGSSNPPRVDSITYIAGLSTTSQLTFLVRLTNTDSPMQMTIGARLN